MGDMSALVAADSDGTYVLQLVQLVAVRVEVDNVKRPVSGIADYRKVLRMLRFVAPASCDEGPNSATHEPDAFRTIQGPHAHMSPLLLP
jgi:hypothetical protein